MSSTEKRGIRGLLRRPAGVALCAIVTAAAASFPALADQVVYFVNGKAMTVKTVEKGPKITVLEVEGGGRIGVPTLQIDRIEELQPATAPPPATLPATGTMVNTPQPVQQPAAPAQVAAGAPGGAPATAAVAPPPPPGPGAGVKP